MPKKNKLEELKNNMPAPKTEEIPELEELAFEDEDEAPEAEGMDFSEYSDEDLQLAVEEAKSRGLLEGEEEMAEEDEDLEELEMDDELDLA